MSVIANVDFETNNLNVFTGGTSDADGDMTIQAAAALCGTNYGLQVVIDDTNAAYGSVGNLNSTTGKARARFYIDPNSPTFDTSEDVKVAAFRNTSAAFLAFVSLLKTGSNWYIAAGAYNDASSFTAATSIAITDAPHCVEFYLQRATNATSNDGRFDVWVDGTGQQSVTNIDNYDRFDVMGYVRLGAISFSGTPLGTIYLDQLIVNDDGGEIGAYKHDLTSTNITTGAPTLGAPTLESIGNADNLTATNIVTGAPTLGAPTVGIVYVIDDIILEWADAVHALTATNIITGVPTLGAPTIDPVHKINAAGILTGLPILMRRRSTIL